MRAEEEFASPGLQREIVLAVVLTAGYYLLTLAVAGAMLFVVILDFRRGPWISVFSVLFLFASASLMWSLLPSRDKWKPPGPRLSWDSQTRLLDRLRNVTDALGQEMPEEIYLSPMLNAAVMERTITGWGAGRRQRVMILGLPLLQLLTVEELRFVFAHEMGHFAKGHLRLMPWVRRTQDGLRKALGGPGIGLFQWPFRLYAILFLKVTAGLSRNHEYEADAVAARLTSPKTARDVLIKVQGADVVFAPFLFNDLIPVLRAGYRPPLAEGLSEFLDHPKITSMVDRMVAISREEDTLDPWDSHPPLQSRLDALQALENQSPPSPSRSLAARDNVKAISLLELLPDLEAEMIGMLFRDKIPKDLQPIAWEDVGFKVYLPRWRELAARHREYLRGVRPSRLGDWFDDPDATGLALKRVSKLSVPPVGLADFTLSVAGAVLAWAYHSMGWTIRVRLGEPIRFVRHGETCEPLEELRALAQGESDAADWVGITRQRGLDRLTDLSVILPETVEDADRPAGPDDSDIGESFQIPTQKPDPFF